MTGRELKDIVREVSEKKEYAFYGVRFCGQDYGVGEIIYGKSKCLEISEKWLDHENCEWPDYGTEEYNSLPEVGGVFGYPERCLDREFPDDKDITDCKWGGRLHNTTHCYIIASDRLDDDFIPATGKEEVYSEPVVIYKLF